MENLGQVAQTSIEIFGKTISFNPNVFIFTWVVMGIIFILSYLITRKLKIVPTNAQVILESIFEFIQELTESSLGRKDGKKYLPFIITIFLFVLLSNWIGIIPNILSFIGTIIAILSNIIGSDNVTIIAKGLTDISLQVSPEAWYSFLFKVPEFEEPTRSLNTDLALGFSVFLVVHAFGISQKGLKKYLSGYIDEPFEMKGFMKIFCVFNIFFYLNIIGAIADFISHSCRLFGNIFGGFMIIAIVSSLIQYLIVPVGLLAFFGLFAGLVQAFVFTMLAITYIAQQK